MSDWTCAARGESRLAPPLNAPTTTHAVHVQSIRMSKTTTTLVNRNHSLFTLTCMSNNTPCCKSLVTPCEVTSHVRLDEMMHDTFPRSSRNYSGPMLWLCSRDSQNSYIDPDSQDEIKSHIRSILDREMAQHSVDYRIGRSSECSCPDCQRVRSALAGPLSIRLVAETARPRSKH
jgi:hypothetical protein